MTVTVLVTAHEGDKTVSKQIVVSDTALKDVLFSFNVSGEDRVAVMKALFAAAITEMEPIIAAGGSGARTAAIARTDIETAQMRAVKAFFA